MTWDELFKAIYEEFALHTGATDPYTLTSGRLYRTYAPESADFPFIVVTLVSGNFERFWNGTLETARVQFDVYERRTRTSDPALPMKIYQGLYSIFDDSTLTLTDGSTSIIMRCLGPPTEEADEEFIHVFGDWQIERQY